MNIAVLANPDSWHFKDLQRAAGDRHRVSSCTFGGLRAFMMPDRATVFATDQCPANEICLNDLDCVLARNMPAGSLEQVVLRMDLLGQLARNNVLVVNPPKTIEAAVDKYLCLELIRGHGVPVLPTGVCQTATAAREIFADLGGDVVVKPIFGSEGKGLQRISDPKTAAKIFQQLEQDERAIYLQQFVDHGGSDLRLLVIGDRVHAMSRHNPSHWITNASRGARCNEYSPTRSEKDLAIKSVRAVGAILAGVDIVYDQNDRPFVLEVNASPGWRTISRTNRIDVASQILAELQTQLAIPGSGLF